MSTHPTSTQTPQTQTTISQLVRSVEDLIDNNPDQYAENALIRLKKFQVANAAVTGKIGVTFNKNTDVYLGGVVKIPTDDGRFINDRVMMKTPYESKDTINDMWDTDCHTRYDGGRWHFEADAAEMFISHMLDNGFLVAGPIQLISNLLGIEPSDSEPQSTATTKTGYTVDSIDLETDTLECPVPGCDYVAETFEELRGHIGGMVNAGHDDHKEAGLLLKNYE